MTIPHAISRRLWIPLLALIVGVPTISWFLHINPNNGFPWIYYYGKLAGQITGIIGAQLFAFSLLLSARIKSIECLFGGLDKLYVIHHRVGVIAFSFLALHPLFLAFRFLEDGMRDVMLFLMPGNDSLAKDFGIYAFLLMFGLLVVTFYGVIFSYKSLKNAHKFMGLAFFLGALHMFLMPSSMNNDIVLKISCLGMAFVGLLAFTYRTLLGDFFVTRYDYVVKTVTNINQGIVEITLKPTKEIMRHLSGQFAMLSFVTSDVVSDESHPFTISSSPRNNGEIRFSIKSLGDYTSLLGRLTVGTKATLEGPYGEFHYGYGSTSQIWVAGGIGVTPFVSMAEDLLAKDSIDYTIDFFYSVRTDGDGVYKELFTSLAKKHSSFTFHCMPSDVAGFITGELLVKDISDAKSRDIFVCGPPPMMAGLTDSLTSLGVPSQRIHSERFSLLR